MNLYRWRSDFMTNYQTGYIIVMAPDVETAMRMVADGAEEHFEDRRNWVCPDKKPDAVRNCLVSVIAADLAKEPEISKDGCWFIAGGDG